MVPDRIEREVLVAAPVERVWTVVTDGEHIARWFGDSAEVDLRPGGKIVLGWREYGNFHAVIERLEPPRVFAYRGAYAPDEAPVAGNSTLVEFTLTPERDGTRLRVVETGFTALDMPEEEQRKRAEDNTDGWRIELDELRAYAEGEPAG